LNWIDLFPKLRKNWFVLKPWRYQILRPPEIIVVKILQYFVSSLSRLNFFVDGIPKSAKQTRSSKTDWNQLTSLRGKSDGNIRSWTNNLFEVSLGIRNEVVEMDCKLFLYLDLRVNKLAGSIIPWVGGSNISVDFGVVRMSRCWKYLFSFLLSSVHFRCKFPVDELLTGCYPLKNFLYVCL